MERPISYTDVKRRFPVQVKEALADLRKGKSKDKDMPPKDMKWSFNWSLQVQGYSVKQLFDGTAQKDRRSDDAKTLAEKVADEVARTHFSIMCKAGRGYGVSKTPMGVPQEFVDEIRHRKMAAEEEKEKNAKLSPEERQAEIQKLLGQLPGVIGVQVGPQGPKVVDPLKALGDALRADGAEDIKVSETKADDLKGVPTIDLTNKTQQIRDFFAQQHEDEKNYFKNMLANIPPGVPQIAIDAVRRKLDEMEKHGVPEVVVEEGKVTKHTVEELLDADDDKLANLAANFSAHARKKLKDGNGHGA